MRTLKRTLALALGATMALAGCASDGEETPQDPTTGAEEAPSGDETEGETGSAGEPEGGAITIGVPAGWDEAVAVSNLWAVYLEDLGYEVDLLDADMGVLYGALAKGDVDIVMDTWLPVTHEDYWVKYGDQLEDLGVWYDDAKLTIAVNSDSPITSLDELAENADLFNNEIVGIDAGAGLTRITQDEVIPTYGLEDMDFLISSTSAMLASLDAAQRAGEDIVVTLWTPHWAYGAYDIRNLEDPEGALGGAESVHTVARQGFTADFPWLAERLTAFEMADEHLADLENLMLNENPDRDYQESAAEWLEANADFFDTF